MGGKISGLGWHGTVEGDCCTLASSCERISRCTSNGKELSVVLYKEETGAMAGTKSSDGCDLNVPLYSNSEFHSMASLAATH
jgi:hypothetical protein